MISEKRRARRMASDEAHAWARSLELCNPNGKSVLRALTLYVNGEGTCFVSIEQLSYDTDLSHDTVRRRLVWLDQIGAIVRLPQWIDGNGRRNAEGKGKRTTDEIRLLLDADTDVIESKAKGNVDEFSPSREQPQDFTSEDISPSPALGQPSQSCDHLISEPEPEESPQPPSGGSVDIASLEGWKEFEADWGKPILRVSLAQQIWAALKPEERIAARQAARGYAADLNSQRKPPNRIGAHLFLKERGAWEGFAKLAPAADAITSGIYAPGSPQAQAIIGLYAVGGGSVFEHRGRISYRGEITSQILKFGDLPDRGQWLFIDDRAQLGSWNALFTKHIFGSRRDVMIRRNDRLGLLAPWPWPPDKSGKIYTVTGPPGQAETLMNDEDYANI